ncbi:autotransporter outer membrane beta-barrel domain-containing protein [Nonlabens marinus]|uniref:Multidrug transporter n=1 Tax=Nonlabens marinus S1-08 TaxID=1454201 RepID=W8VZS6_9FLAO|nr:hypothetical protein [Nonlabens marinus]BAO55091.1 hypothetical protein NMS_1082 [Nonlabens marinus S1-08]
MKNLILSMLAIAAITITSCSTDDDVSGPTTPTDGLNLSGDITSNRTLSAGNAYVLNGPLFVKTGATLTIEAGTTITANAGGTDVYLLVEKGGRIVANGTAAAPIRFTSTSTTPAAWGGVIINGNAFISGQNPQGQNVAGTEVNQALLFGGNNDTESSGILNYVIIEYTGARIDGEAEHNGLTLNGVGSGTTLSNIWLANGDDDGIEFFGGSVNASNIFVLNAKDDMFDVTQGYRGTLTNIFGVREPGYTAVTSDPRGIEADGNLDGNSPSDNTQSVFTINGVTIQNRGDNVEFSDLIKVRRGATATITNALAGTFGTATAADFIDLEDSKGNATSATQITATASGTADGSDIKNAPNATVTVNANQTGANAAAFSWTGYNFL